MRIQHLIYAIVAAAALFAAYTWWAQPSWTPSWLERTPGAAAPAGVTAPGARDFRGYAGILELERLEDHDDGRLQLQVNWASFGTMPGAHGHDASNIRQPLTGEHQVRFPIQVGTALYFAVINTPSLSAMAIDDVESFHVTWVRQAPHGVRYDPGTITVGDGGEIPTDG